MNPPTHLDPSHPTTSFSADPMTQFARAVGLEVSLASYSMLGDLLLKAKGGSEALAKTSRNTAGRSPFPSVAGSSMGDSIASRSVYSLPTITETEGTDAVVSGDIVEEPCSSRLADARLALGYESVERPGTDSLKTLQQIKSSQRKENLHLCKWSSEGRLNPLLPAGDDKGGYVFTEGMLELAPFAKVFATGPEDPLENKYCFYCMLCRRNISMRTRGLYELKRHYQRDFHFRADQRFREKHCPGKVRCRGGRVLYGSKLEVEHEVYMELDVPDLDFKRPFYYDVLEGKPFTFTNEESRVRIQISLLITFLKSEGQLWALEDYWTQVGIATGHSAATADFNWSPAHISVSNFGFSSKFHHRCGIFILWAICGHHDCFLSGRLFCLGISRILCRSFDHVLFQALLHHCFVVLRKQIALVLGREEVYSLKFTTTSIRRKLSIRFWEGKDLVTMTVAQCGRDVPSVKSSVLLCSQLLSAVSLEPTIICFAGGSADFIKALDKAPNQKARLQYPFNLLPLQVEKLMHKPSFSILGKIDMFSMVRTLLVRLSGFLDEKWTQSTQYFRKVRLFW